MAENYGIRAGLGPDYESKYHMRAQPAPENIGVNSEAMDFQMPYRATFLNGLPESKEDYVSALAHGMNSNDDDASNARYQELLQKREELKKQIAQLSADIAYQERLRALEMKNDPMWDIAKQQYIMKGDSSGLESIMSRMEAEKGRDLTRETAKAAKAAEDASKKEANLRAANTARVFLEDAYDTFMANKASKINQIQSRADLFRKYQDFKDKADAAGKDYNDFFADKTFLQNVDLELQEALVAMQEETEKKVANAKTAANIAALKNTVKSEVDSWNAGTHTTKETNAEISRLKKAYPQFDFKMKGGKIEQNYNPKKGGKK